MPSKKSYVEIVKYRRHFRIYFKNNHPAYIVGEDGDMYIFHRVTHSKSSGGKKTWEKVNPIDDGDPRKIHIVKKEEKDSKGRFSLFKIRLKKNADVSYPEIKKAGGAQANHDLVKAAHNISTSTNIKTNKRKGSKK